LSRVVTDTHRIVRYLWVYAVEMHLHYVFSAPLTFNLHFQKIALVILNIAILYLIMSHEV